MSTAPTTTHVQDVDADDDENPSWVNFASAAVLLAFAVVPWTSLWAELSNPEEASRKYRGIARLLDTLGPLPVSAVFGVLGVIMLVVAVNSVRKGREG